MFCTLEELKTESDVEQKLLWPLLSQDSPAGLGYATAEVTTKSSLKRLQIGKGATAKVFFPDYVVLVGGVPLLVVEAKRPGENLEEAAQEARMYAARINEFFPPTANPCRWILASNGQELVVTSWDSSASVIRVQFEEVSVTNVRYTELVESLQRSRLAPVAAEFRRAARRQPLRRAVARMGGKSARNEQIGHNTFGSTLALDYQHVFTPVSPAERAYVVRNAYVPSKRRERYVEPIEKLVRRATLPFLSHIPAIEETDRPVEVESKLRMGASLEHQLMLLIGSVGSGKSTFVDHLVNVALPEKLLKETLWIRVNLNLAPKEGLQEWLLDQVCEGNRSGGGLREA